MSLKTKHSRPGFTLLELLAVLLLIGIILSVAMPRISGTSRVKLRSSARRLAGTVRLTYHLAVLNKKNYRLLIDLDQQSYRIEERFGDEYKPVSSDMLQERVLPQGVWVRQIRIADRECENNCMKEYLYFSPFGYVEEAAIYLTDDDEQQAYTLLTRPMTGRVVIREGYAELPREKDRR